MVYDYLGFSDSIKKQYQFRNQTGLLDTIKWQSTYTLGARVTDRLSGDNEDMLAVRLIVLITTALFVACGDEHGDSGFPEYADPETDYQPAAFGGPNAKADGYQEQLSVKRVAWEPVGRCDVRRISEMRITIELEDADSSNLQFEGSVTGCRARGLDHGPSIRSAQSEVLCHHVTSHTGIVVIRDDSGRAATTTFRFGPCERGETAP